MQSLWTILDWKKAYHRNEIQIDDLYEYFASFKNDDYAWISIASKAQLNAQIEALKNLNPDALPLYGIPFAVKDNIDVAGFHTTAACKEAEYLATSNATVVARLKGAGAIVVGKTNLDQFATGLVGVRSPYGAVKNSFNPNYISGGSSSGSSVVVANGLVPFSLGTDTAGSGRVPAGHNNIVGLKPTKGWFSTQGIIPACRTIDVVSIFALTTDDTWQVAQIMQDSMPKTNILVFILPMFQHNFLKAKLRYQLNLNFTATKNHVKLLIWQSVGFNSLVTA